MTDISRLIKELRDEDYGVRADAADALGAIGDVRAVQPLIKTIVDKNEFVRAMAVTALGKIGDSCAVEPLSKMLGDSDTEVRVAAAEALGEIGGERAVEVLIIALEATHEQLIDDGGFHGPRHDKEYCPRMEFIAEALGMTGDNLAVKPLIDILDDGYSEVREAATQALVEIGEPAVPALIDALGSWEGTTRSGAAEALKEFGWKPGTDELRALFLIALENWEECIELGDLAVEPLIAALQTEPRTEEVGEDGRYFSHEAVFNIRFGAAETLVEFGERSVEPLIKALGHDWCEVRQIAAEALGKIGDARAVEPLIKALGDDDGYVRETAAEALGKIGDLRAVKPLITALEDGNSSGAKALGEITEANIKGKEKKNIMRFLESDDPAMVMMGASMLKGILK